MNGNKQDLSRLLKRWQDIEAPGNFDANVWRRIRQAEPACAPSLLDWLREWVPRPVLALSVAVVAGVAIGTWSGTWSVTSVDPSRELGFLAPNTLAGSHLGR